jgi:aminoglycoside phosphotransferase (APT) family kinase protein
MKKSPNLAVQLTAFLRSKLGDGVSITDGPSRLRGGFDTDTYAFSIENQPGDIPAELVLRHFQTPGESNRVALESTIQNSAYGAGKQVPQVPIESTGAFLNNRPFLIMERLPGSALGGQISDESLLVQVPETMAKLQLGIHRIDVLNLTRKLSDFGIDIGHLSPATMLYRISKLSDACDDPALSAINTWLSDNWPAQPLSPVICHGDFHPNNVLYHEGKVTGIIDWGNVVFSHAEYDVAVTRLTLSIGPIELDIDARSAMQPMIDQLVAQYLAVYRATLPLDDQLLDYYSALRSAHAYAKVVANRKGIDTRFAAKDGYAWGLPLLFTRISEVLETTTGVTIN